MTVNSNPRISFQNGAPGLVHMWHTHFALLRYRYPLQMFKIHLGMHSRRRHTCSNTLVVDFRLKSFNPQQSYMELDKGSVVASDQGKQPLCWRSLWRPMLTKCAQLVSTKICWRSLWRPGAHTWLTLFFFLCPGLFAVRVDFNLQLFWSILFF